MKKKNAKRIMIRLTVLLILLLMIGVVFTAIRIVRYGQLDEKTRCDAAIVLGAATSGEEVSPVYRERINHAVWLYENGYVDYLILTGGVGDGKKISDAFLAKQYVISLSVPEEAVLMEEKSRITEENLEYAKAIMEEHSLDTAIIVSDPLHMKRAMLMAQDYGIEAYSSPTPTTMYRSVRTKAPFLAREVFFYIGYSIVRWFR